MTSRYMDRDNERAMERERERGIERYIYIYREREIER